MKQNRITSIFAVAPFFLLAMPALADNFSLALVTANPTLVPGATYTFMGTIAANANNTGVLAIVADNVTADSPLVIDDTAFYTDTPLTLAPGAFYTGALFTAALPLSATPRTYAGTLDVILDDALGTPMSEDARFSVTVPLATTPEPSSLFLLLSGLPAVSYLRRRFQAQSSSAGSR